MAWTTATTRATGFTVTAAVWNSEIVDNMNFLKEVAYTQFIANVTVTATTEGAANSIVSSGAITYQAVPHLIEFFSPDVISPAANNINLIVTDAGTVVGRIGTFGGGMRLPSGILAHRLTPTAASHTYDIRAYVGASTGTISAGAGGAGNLLPGFIRIRRIPT